MKPDCSGVDEYLKTFPDNVQKLLNKIRITIKENAPEAVEYINYRMPAYKINNKPLVYFAGYKNHIGFYPMPSAIEKFKRELSKYKFAKGSVQLTLDKQLPLGLISKIVKFRVDENSKYQERK